MTTNSPALLLVAARCRVHVEVGLAPPVEPVERACKSDPDPERRKRVHWVWSSAFAKYCPQQVRPPAEFRRRATCTTVEVRGATDPGYRATSKMLSETGLTLLWEHDAVPRAGVLTPATTLGPVLRRRLAATEHGRFMQFRVRREKGPGTSLAVGGMVESCRS